MKRKHTENKKARRSSAFEKSHGKHISLKRYSNRAHLRPALKKSYGCHVKRVQAIKLEKHKGLRIVTIVKFIDHCE